MPDPEIELLTSPSWGKTPQNSRQAVISDIALLLQDVERLNHVSRHDQQGATKPLPPYTARAIKNVELAILYLIQQLNAIKADLPTDQELSDMLNAPYEHLDVTASFSEHWTDAQTQGYVKDRAEFLAKHHGLGQYEQNAIALSKAAFAPHIAAALKIYQRLKEKSRYPIDLTDLEEFDVQGFNQDTQIKGVQSLVKASGKLSRYKNTLELGEQQQKNNLSWELFFKKIALYIFLFTSPLASAEVIEVTHHKIELITELTENLEKKKKFGLKEVMEWKADPKNAQKLNAHRRNTLLSWSDRTQRTDKTATMQILDKYTEPPDQSSSTSRRNTT
ncbi:MAG TPA: hypothetical protein VI522_01775 [Gammaproteobacteria bacterium]|nr:hypothetical protein [Gammaproteobacteria bacterium]